MSGNNGFYGFADPLPVQALPTSWTKLGERLLQPTEVAAVMSFLNIPQGFRDLRLEITARHDQATTDNYIYLRFNNDSGSNYDWQTVFMQTTTNSASSANAQTLARIADIPGANATAGMSGYALVDIPSYATSTWQKVVMSHAMLRMNVLTGGADIRFEHSSWRNAAPITQIDVLTNSGNFVAGTQATLYGI